MTNTMIGISKSCSPSWPGDSRKHKDPREEAALPNSWVTSKNSGEQTLCFFAPLVTDVGKAEGGWQWGGTGAKSLVLVYSLRSQKLSELTGKLLGLCFPEMIQKQVGLL